MESSRVCEAMLRVVVASAALRATCYTFIEEGRKRLVICSLHSRVWLTVNGSGVFEVIPPSLQIALKKALKILLENEKYG